MTTTRDALLDEAEILVRRRGYSGSSYADLSQAVGLRKASIHHHFPAKADLAVALLANYDRRYDASLADILAATGDGAVRVKAYADLYLQGIDKGMGCLCAAFAAELTSLPDRLRSDLTRFFEKHVAWVERVLAEGQENGTVRGNVTPPAFARLIVAALEGALMMERTLDGASGFGTMLSALERALRPA